MSLRVQLRFATAQGFLSWRVGTPNHGFDYDLDPPFIPNDAPKPPMVREVFPELGGTNEQTERVELREAKDLWDAAAAFAHAAAHGGEGRAVLVDVPFRWADEDDDPRDAKVTVLLTVEADGRVDSRTLSGRQAKAYLAHEGEMPSVKEMKVLLRKR